MQATAEQETPREAILRVAKELGLSMSAEFVPFSQSRNKNEKHPSLNWIVTLVARRLGPNAIPHTVLTTDYMAGSGHCPSYKQGDNSLDRLTKVKYECETGRNANYGAQNKHIKPDLADVLYSLVSDASVLDSGSFEDWASEFGYDTDSRKAEATYRACLDIALKLRNGVGEDGLAQLREACQDY